MTVHCPCCGQAVAVDPVTATRAALTPMQRAIFDIVMRRPGLSRERLADVVYADDPQGGPDFADSVISVHITQANKRLRAFGLRVTCGGKGSRAGYRLERLP